MNQTTQGLNNRSLLISALIAGVAIGLLSNIPLIACLNCLLFAWVWVGGIAAVYLYQKNENLPYLNNTQGLLLGAAAGVIGALIGGVFSLLFQGLSAAFATAFNDALGENGRLIPNFLVSTGFSILGIFRDIVIYAIFGAIGGLLATVLIWKAPAAPLAPPPPYTPPPDGPTL